MRIYERYGKRTLDMLASAFLLALLWPLFLLITLLIKLDSKGRAFFVQERISKGGGVFKMYKFRTMCENAEHIGTGAYSFEHDPRITRIGSVLRKLSLDELPQLLNILKGDMSFVGPRPVLTYHPCRYEEYSEEEKQVFRVRPGITGWAQVNGRNAADWIRRFELNEWYVNHVSFALDLKIVLKTVAQVFSAKEIVIEQETAKAFQDRKRKEHERK